MLRSASDQINNKMIKKFTEFVNEKKQTYDYGCVMLYFDFTEMNKIHDAIDPIDVYTEDDDQSYGYETEPHCTLLYGLHEGVTTEEVQAILDKYKYDLLDAHNASLFENEKYDVLKFDIAGKNLHEANADLKQHPFTSDFPDYHPHMTIAYLKPGKGKRWANMLDGHRFKVKPTHAIYSKPSGEKDRIEIKTN
jgi:2'-5' RNA ligase